MRLEIQRVENVFEGMSFGSTGTYEKIVGRAYGEVDPTHPLNRDIINLDKAPTNTRGRVEYAVDFCVLKPTDLGKSNRRILYDTLNRGDKLALIDINDAQKGPTSNDPVSAADAGNGFLMRQGYVLVFSAWQGDTQPGEGHMLAEFPVATNNGAPIVGDSREEMIFGHTDSPAVLPLTYPAHSLDQSNATLTVRLYEADARIPVPAERWRYVSPRQIEIDLVEGFDAGAIYEFIYPACDPIVMGLGFVAVRDFVTYMRSTEPDTAGQPHPLSPDPGAPAIDHVIAYGRSQPGRFLREFVRLGFNQALNGGQVFDGIYASIAGSRRIFLNEPFAQPGRFHRQQEDHLYPGDQFPFSYATRTDSVSDKTDGILARSLATDTCPKIIHVDSSTEFWLGRSSLVVTDEHGEDIEVPDEVRVFLFSGTGHAGPIMLNHAAVFSQNPAYAMNFLNYNPLNRSLLIALDQWATQGIAPPDSRVPRSGDGTLVPPSPQAETGFPAIPGVRHPERVNELSAMDYSQQPPVPVSGKAYRVLVPKVDADGNELAGIHLPAISVPLGTHTGWNLRGAGFSPGALMLVGSYFPFAATRAERQANRDPRPSLEERYPSHDAYVVAVSRAAAELQEARLLLAEDAERYVAAAKAASVGG